MSITGPDHSVLPSDPAVPGWRVVSLIDPDGAGQDLAFTQGLAAFQLPELLLWARPTEGLDPGADWLLSHRERSRLLSVWALEMVTGQLGCGDEREERFDGGGTLAKFRFGRPTSSTALHHPHLPEQTRVLSISWSLVRREQVAPGGARAPLNPEVERRVQRWIRKAETTTAGWRSRLDARPVKLTGGRPRSTPSRAAAGDHRFGPMTAWVDVRIAQLLAAESEVIGAFLRRLQLAALARREEGLLEQLTQLAVSAGRTAVCRRVSQAAQEVSLKLISQTEPDPLGVVLTDGVEVLLLGAVLADLTPSSIIASGAGPWEWAVSDERLPGRQWLAPPQVRQATRALLAGAGPAQLVAAADRARLPFGLAERHDLAQLLGGLQTTAAASAHPGSMFRREQRRGLPRSIVRSADGLARQLLTAMALPDRLPPGGWDLVRATVYPLAPELPRWR